MARVAGSVRAESGRTVTAAAAVNDSDSEYRRHWPSRVIHLPGPADAGTAILYRLTRIIIRGRQ
jgi:hypothetical protein